MSGDTGSKTADKSSNFNTLITIGNKSNRGGIRSTPDDDLDGSFERLDDASLQGSTDDLYSNETARGDGKKKGQQICVRREVQVESSEGYTDEHHRERVVNIPLRDL